MWNLLITLGIAAITYLVAALVAHLWIAGLVPALLAGGIAYFLLARRTGKQLEAVVAKVGQLLQLDPMAPVHIKKQRLAEAVSTLESARPMGRWQFLVEAQIDGQLGQLAYMQMDFKKARPHLEKAWSRNWAAQGMLAALDFRDKKLDLALKRLEKTSGAGSKEAMFWGLYAWMLVETKQTDKALEVLARALKALPDSTPLKEMRNAVSNQKKFPMKTFGEMWYAFFPEKMMEDGMIPMPQQANRGPGFPMPRGAKMGRVGQRKG